MTEKQLNLKYLKKRYKHPTWEVMLEISSEQYIRGLKQGKFDCEMEQLEKIEYLKNKIENKDNWCQLIADIGFDYDGCNKVDSLKCLIDELVKYALYSRDSYDYEEFIKEGNNE